MTAGAGVPRAVQSAAAKVGLSTASVYPESTAVAFELAGKLGYDGVEVMVWTDPVSQDPYALQRLSQHYGVAILAIHAPCLIITQRVWTTDPWTKLQKAQFAAELLGAQTVVVHPPFRWQRDYARGVPRRCQAVEPGDRRPLRRREHVPAAGPRARGVGLPAELGRLRRRAVPRLHPRPVALGGLAVRRDGNARRDGHAPEPPAHRRRHRPAEGRAPGAGSRATSRARRSSSGSPRARSTGTWSSRSTPGGRSTAPSARPIWPRRWRSAGCTW